MLLGYIMYRKHIGLGLALIIFIVILFIMFFYHIMFHFEPQSCIYPCRMTYMETKQMGNSTNFAGKN